MHILVSNDDGYLAPGLSCLVQTLTKYGQITVVAPDRDRSGASNSLTLNRPLRAQKGENGYYRVDGTPTDCVHLAITGLLDKEPDMVISGINGGANLGDDVLYSGTVAAAMEGRFLGYPAIAVSLAGYPSQHYQTAAKVVQTLLEQLHTFPAEREMILNVNVPNVPYEQLQGVQITRLGNRHKAEPVIRMQDPRGEDIYWVGPAGEEQDAGPGTDFHAIRNNMVSVSPLQLDLTRHTMLQPLEQWMKSCDF